MQAHRFYLLLAISLFASIITPLWQLSVVTIALTILLGWTEYMLREDVKKSSQYDKRLKDIEEAIRNQSFGKVFK